MIPDESARFLVALREDRNETLFALALSTGMRPEEYLGLRWIDLDLAETTVTVRRALVWRWLVLFTEPKTSRSRRTIPLPASMIAALVSRSAVSPKND